MAAATVIDADTAALLATFDAYLGDRQSLKHIHDKNLRRIYAAVDHEPAAALRAGWSLFDGVKDKDKIALLDVMRHAAVLSDATADLPRIDRELEQLRRSGFNSNVFAKWSAIGD